MHISTAAKFGLIVGVVGWAMISLIGPAALFLTIGLMLAVHTTVVWRRTRLPLMTAGTALGTLVSLAIAGLEFKGTSSSVQLAIGCVLTATFILCITIEKRWHPEKMSAWQRASKSVTLADMLRLNHVPNLTGRITQANNQRERQP